jgi:hypothetical protein
MEPLSQPLDSPAQHCGDLVFESLVTEREAAIGCASDFVQIFFVQVELKQTPACGSSLLGCLTGETTVSPSWLGLVVCP